MFPLRENKDDYTKDNDAHLINKYDQLGGIPEYKPYSLVNYQYQPLIEWQQSANASTFTQKQPLEIKDPQTFKALTTVEKPIYFKIEDEKNIQIIKLPKMTFLERKVMLIKNKPSMRKNLCISKHGHLEEDSSGQCTTYYWTAEVCVMIARDEKGKWFLDDQRYEQNSFGCSYQPKIKSKMLKYEHKINNVFVKEQLFLDRTRPLSMFFPMEYPSIEF